MTISLSIGTLLRDISYEIELESIFQNKLYDFSTTNKSDQKSNFQTAYITWDTEGTHSFNRL
jgi:hypothetical protein